jgi:hypothetical protein
VYESLLELGYRFHPKAGEKKIEADEEKLF